MVAMGTFRSGRRTTAAATMALSMPVNDQNTRTSEVWAACSGGCPDTFQALRNICGSNHSQPNRATARTGSRPTIRVAPPSLPTKRGPAMLARVTSQITTAVQPAAASG